MNLIKPIVGILAFSFTNFSFSQEYESREGIEDFLQIPGYISTLNSIGLVSDFYIYDPIIGITKPSLYRRDNNIHLEGLFSKRDWSERLLDYTKNTINKNSKSNYSQEPLGYISKEKRCHSKLMEGRVMSCDTSNSFLRNLGINTKFVIDPIDDDDGDIRWSFDIK